MYFLAFNLLKNLWLYFSTYWKDSGYGFQLVENILAMVFNLLKKFWLCFSTCWKIYGYAFQPVEKNLAMLFNFWKVIFYEFQVSEKFCSMVFRAWKVQKSLTVSLFRMFLWYYLRSVSLPSLLIFWKMKGAISKPFFCVKVLCNCVNTGTRLNVIMLEINRSCYQITRGEILLTLAHFIHSESVLLLTFQIFQIFQEMKYFFLCFSTSWKIVFYGIQIFEKLFSMLFRFWKENFYAFHQLEKVILWFSVYTLGS